MRATRCLVGPLVVLALLANGAHSLRAAENSSLIVVEGVVVEVGVRPGEGGLDLVTVRLAATVPEKKELDLLLAPSSVLEETGFAVQEGDHLKAKIFSTDEGPAAVHKVLNQTQGSILRLRTLRQIPLWNGAGVWQGGPGHRGHGERGQHQPKQGGHGPPR